MNRWILSTVLFAPLIFIAGNVANFYAQGPAKDKDDVAGLLKQIDKSQPKNVRLAAFKKLEDRAHDNFLAKTTSESKSAIPLLKSCCKEKDAEIRRGAQAALAIIVAEHKMACPIEVVEGFFDDPNGVSNHVFQIDNFAPECLPLLMKGLASEVHYTRGYAVRPLKEFAARDAEVLDAIRKVAVGDKFLPNRHVAHMVLFEVTNDLRELLHFRLQLCAVHLHAEPLDVARMLAPENWKNNKGDLGEQLFLATSFNINLILFTEFAEKRPKQFAEALIGLKNDESPVVREGAAHALGTMIKTHPQTLLTLVHLKVRQVLAAMCDDVNENVRKQARDSLLIFMNEETSHPPAAAKDNPIQTENRKPGSSDWQLTRVKVDKDSGNYRSSLIEGYCSHQSVQAGETLKIMVSTAPAARFKIEIFRTGYYGGKGARLMTTLGPLQGKPQPVPPVGERSLRECKWEPSAELKIPDDWVSGVYLGRLTTIPPVADAPGSPEPYWQSYVVFIVRDNRKADILFQCSDNTWQAYNRWPDKYSVYTNPKGVEGPWSDVSFDRPYAKYAQIYDNPQSIGSGEWLCFEFPLAYWLEQQGYDVAYCSNSDMIDLDRGLKCKAFLSVGHDEYWDIRAYNSVQKMRDAGVNLLFLSGNAVCWVTPQKPSSDGRANRIIFRGGPYGGKHKWAELREKLNGPFPERGPDEGYLIGARNVDPVNGGGDWIVTKPNHWIFKGTGMKKGDRVPGLIGWEYHGDPPADLPGLEILAEGTAFQGGTRPQHWTATIYPGPKNNFVFNASTIFWSQALSSPPGHMLPWSHWSRPHGPDERVQQITRNLLDKALGKEK